MKQQSRFRPLTNWTEAIVLTYQLLFVYVQLRLVFVLYKELQVASINISGFKQLSVSFFILTMVKPKPFRITALATFFMVF